MAKWGWREHRYENHTNILLILSSLFSVSFVYSQIILLGYISCGLILLTTIVHFFARLFHILEKRAYNKIHRK